MYVHGRLINPEDAGFGIDRNLLRHGTFSRFRVVINIDRLDEELRSSRESLRDGPQLVQARALLQALLTWEKNGQQATGAFVDSTRVNYSPGPSSPLRNVARRIPGVNTSLDGLRYQTTPDAGAEERITP